MDAEEAVETIRRARECVRPNKGFAEQLRLWETECQDKRLESLDFEEDFYTSGRSTM